MERQDTTDYMITDFESGNLTTPLNGFWYFFTDGNSATAVDTIFGNSKLTSLDEGGFPFYDSLGNPDTRTFPPGYGAASTRCLKFAYELGDRRLSCGDACTYAPYVGFGMGFTTLADSLDLSAAAGISFWARAEKAPLVMNVSVGTRDTTTGAPDYSRRYVLDTTWKLYTLELKASTDFKQPAYGPRKPFVASLVKSMNFGVNRDENDSALTKNAIYIDDLAVMDWTYVDPSVGLARDARRARTAHPRLEIAWTGNRATIRIPEAFASLQGRVEAVDAAGRLLGSAGFGPALREVVVDLAARNRSGVWFRLAPLKEGSATRR